jgi:hypothetical protein
VFAIAFCDNTEISTVFGDISREHLAIGAVSIDVLITLLFFLSIMAL